MPWCTAESVLDLVAAMLHKAPEKLSDPWVRVIPEALQVAEADLTGVLGAKGYTTAQLESWDHRASFLRSQAAFRAAEMAAAMGATVPLERFEKLDRVTGLKDVLAIRIGGAIAPPTPGDVGGIAFGTVAATDRTLTTFDAHGYFS